MSEKTKWKKIKIIARLYLLYRQTRSWTLEQLLTTIGLVKFVVFSHQMIVEEVTSKSVSLIDDHRIKMREVHCNELEDKIKKSIKKATGKTNVVSSHLNTKKLPSFFII